MRPVPALLPAERGLSAKSSTDGTLLSNDRPLDTESVIDWWIRTALGVGLAALRRGVPSLRSGLPWKG